MTSASILDLLRAFSVAISAASLDLLKESATLTSVYILDLLNAFSVAI
jgi:hypothetical protein